MSELYEAVRREVDEFKAKLNDVLEDSRVTVGEIPTLLRAVYSGIIDVWTALMVESEKLGGSLEDRKKVIVDAVGKLYNEVIVPLDLPGPDAVLDRVLRPGLLAATEFAVDYLQQLIHGGGKWKLVKSDEK